MRLARKLTLALLLGIALVMAVSASLQVTRERELFASDTAADELEIARAVRAAVAFIATSDGVERAEALVRAVDAAERRTRLRWVALDDLPGDGLQPDARGMDGPHLDGAAIAVLRAGREVSVEEQVGDDRRRFTYLPVVSANDEVRPFAIEVSESLAPQAAYIRGSQVHIVLKTLLIIGVCGLVVSFVGMWLVGRPIQALSEKTRRIGEGDLAGPLDLPQNDEIGALARDINAMCEHLAMAQERAQSEAEMRLTMLEQLRHADRLKTVGQLASGVAHELGTPLNVVSGRAKLIADRRVDGDEAADSARIVMEQAERMAVIIRQLLDFSRRREPRLLAGDLGDIAARTVEMLATLARKRRVAVTLERGAEPTLVVVDHGQLQQVLTNLVVNAIQASPPGGHVTVSVGRTVAQPPSDVGGPPAEHAFVRVADGGHGIAPEHLPHVFDPFFTTKPVGEGTGLGLAVSYGIVRDHHGWIAVRSEVGVGSELTVHLPLPDAPSAVVATMQSAGASA
ncbi:HAMP domain-containing histidine kinase [Candidatus Binatia bacterium]|nr:HAMP domain-containing histidine kinase [Candidatus Binatia bacterium]